MTNQTTKPETAAWHAMLDATHRGLTAEQTSAAITEAVLKAVWENARRLYDGQGITHNRCDDGSCNLCILDSIAMAMDRDRWAQLRLCLRLHPCSVGNLLSAAAGQAQPQSQPEGDHP